ncbi:MAG: glycerol-3-phosphate 1-O-acyltransferase, partial [Pseudomonadota bacterium]
MKRLLIHLSTNILYLFVKTNVTPEDSNELIVSDDVPVIYVLKTKSITDYLVLSRETKLRQLPSALDPIKLKNNSRKIPPIFSAHNRNKKHINYTPKHLPDLIKYLTEHPDQSIQLVPVHIRWGQSPDKENSWFKALFSDAWVQPGSLRKLSLILIHGRKVMVSFNEPILLNSQLMNESASERATRKVIRFCRMHFRRQEEAMIGPDLSHRRTIVDNVISQPNVLNTINELSTTKGGKKLELQEKAYKYANEIASDYSYSNIRFLDIVLTHVWNSIYNGIDVKGIDRLKQNAGANEIVYVPCHRSHVDYLLLSYVLFSKGLATPY